MPLSHKFIVAIWVLILAMLFHAKFLAPPTLHKILYDAKKHNGSDIILKDAFPWPWEIVCVHASIVDIPGINKKIQIKIGRFFNFSTHYDYLVFDNGKTYFQIDEMQDKVSIQSKNVCLKPNDTIKINGNHMLWIELIQNGS